MQRPNTAPMPPTAPRARKPDAVATRENIMAVAREEFAAHGLAGARVDAIAARTSTAKRMIYYYFGSKEGLYLAVLEAAYADIRRSEGDLHIEQLAPAEAIARLIDFTFEYDEAHPDFIRLVATENMHRASHIARSDAIKAQNRGVIVLLGHVIERGQREGVFRRDVDPLDIHLMISSFCFFRVSNRHTFGALFGRDMSDPEWMARQKRMLTEAVLSALGVGASARRGSVQAA